MSTRERLMKVFGEALDIPKNTEVEKLAYRSFPAWDSVGHMRLVAALETEFGIMLTTEQILDLSSFDQGVETLKSYGVTD
jgi:acyl carrier protein